MGTNLFGINCYIFKSSTSIIICLQVVRIGMPKTPRLCAENLDSIQITNFPKQCMVNSRVWSLKKGWSQQDVMALKSDWKNAASVSIITVPVQSQKSFATVKSYQAIWYLFHPHEMNYISDFPPVNLVQCTRFGCKRNNAKVSGITSGNVVLEHLGGFRPFWWLHYWRRQWFQYSFSAVMSMVSGTTMMPRLSVECWGMQQKGPRRPTDRSSGSSWWTALPGRDTCPWTSSSVMDPRLPSQTATTTKVWRAWGVSWSTVTTAWLLVWCVLQVHHVIFNYCTNLHLLEQSFIKFTECRSGW